jgi:hypothetical protein
MLSNFNFKIIRQFRGYNSGRDKTNLDPRFAIRGSQNVYKKQSGTMAARPGLKRRGGADATVAGTKSSDEWESSIGITRPFRVSNSKLEVESDIVTSGTFVWYSLQTALTKTRFVWDTIWDNTLKKDFAVFVRGDANIFRWDGGIGIIVSTTSNTIVLNASVVSLGFATSGGDVTINGTSYNYTGSSGSTLTGVTADPTGEATGSVVISNVIPNADTPEAGFICDFIKTINNQLHVGSYASRVAHISNDADYTNYTVPATRTPGDPELLIFDNLLRGFGTFGGVLAVTAGFKDWYSVKFQQITVGATLTEQTLVDKFDTSKLDAALAHEYITNIGETLVFLSRKQEIRVLGNFKNINSPSLATLSLPIKDELFNLTFSAVQGETSGGELKSVGEKLYLTSTTDGKTFIHETRETLTETGEVSAERFWNPPQIWGISRVAVIGGVEYGHSIANPQIYQLWDTEQWSDDSPSDEDMPYTARLRMAYRNVGKRGTLLSADMAYYEGYMPEGTILKSTVFFDYQGSESLQVIPINDPEDGEVAKFFTGFSTVGLGDSSIGNNPLGEGLTEEELSQETIPKFRRITDLSPVDAFELAIEVFSEEVDSRWEMLALGTNATSNELDPDFIRNPE